MFWRDAGVLSRAAGLVRTALFLTLTTASAAPADIAAGEQIFRKCAPCHNITSSGNRMGPHLMGIVGRAIGSVPDFRSYSQAMKSAGQEGRVWTEDLLAEFLYSPRRTIPGNSMRFLGLWSDEDIRNLIAYLKSASPHQ
ncbi:cytochrome c family protein [Aquamicrobium sp.]|uniref:c-type cytochrome n=1 Tax=Aquamicrobium sp. TaxID=1872579 RepID=UPI00258DBCA7|nr:cytochrome c family protein [Aquamicrobium sp.]MCK9553039.1 cytochrome c family protein [Aquamicrobium sp.]